MKILYKVLLLVESSRAAGRELLRGVARYAHHHGTWSCFWKPAGLERAFPEPLAKDVHGLILRDGAIPKELNHLNVPLVIFEHSRGEIRGAVNVITDSAATGRLGAEHLLACGFQHFAFCGYENSSWSERRRRSFQKTLGQAGHKLRATFEAHYDFTPTPWRIEHRSLAKWLRELPKPIGVMACNDDLGHGILEACKLAAISVPDEIAVVGADNDDIVCAFSDPPLSSVAINFERAGYEAARALDQLMRGGQRKTAHIPVYATHVVPRHSTNILAMEDRAVAKALRHIREHAASPMSVETVARASGISRRSLEQRFRLRLGHSILEEIRRERAERIARLLVETEMPIAQIADSLGFADVNHIARYFRKARGRSPLAYRKTFGDKPTGR